MLFLFFRGIGHVFNRFSFSFKYNYILYKTIVLSTGKTSRSIF